jgi:hypothetical protein
VVLEISAVRSWEPNTRGDGRGYLDTRRQRAPDDEFGIFELQVEAMMKMKKIDIAAIEAARRARGL